jgi:hypothetical protein
MQVYESRRLAAAAYASKHCDSPARERFPCLFCIIYKTKHPKVELVNHAVIRK